jgi:hypothetical protein
MTPIAARRAMAIPWSAPPKRQIFLNERGPSREPSQKGFVVVGSARGRSYFFWGPRIAGRFGIHSISILGTISQPPAGFLYPDPPSRAPFSPTVLRTDRANFHNLCVNLVP